jgi:hypothetical protein
MPSPYSRLEPEALADFFPVHDRGHPFVPRVRVRTQRTANRSGRIVAVSVPAPFMDGTD